MCDKISKRKWSMLLLGIYFLYFGHLCGICCNFHLISNYSIWAHLENENRKLKLNIKFMLTSWDMNMCIGIWLNFSWDLALETCFGCVGFVVLRRNSVSISVIENHLKWKSINFAWNRWPLCLRVSCLRNGIMWWKITRWT